MGYRCRVPVELTSCYFETQEKENKLPVVLVNWGMSTGLHGVQRLDGQF